MDRAKTAKTNQKAHPLLRSRAVEAWHGGNAVTKLSLLVFGLGNLACGQRAKGLLYLGMELLLALYFALTGFHQIYMLGSLGTVEQSKVWNETKCIYEYIDGDRSLVILLEGIVAVCILLVLVVLAVSSLKSAYEAECRKKSGLKTKLLQDDLKDLLDVNLHKTLLSLPVIGVVAFTILPLIFMISMAFTNYSIDGNKLVLFDWVGLKNFKNIISFGGSLGKTFWSVLGWTLVWAVSSTFINYILGVLLALAINWKKTRFQKLWRFSFVLSVAVPHFVSLLILCQMLKPEGCINILLRSLGFLGAKESLPFLTNATWARITVVLINIWVGVPYVMLQVTGILQNIPHDLYDAATVDGAGPVKTFMNVTLPYMLFVTTPYLISSFTANVNNFNVIYLTTMGGPTPVDSTAGKTDLLVTWLYKLTMDNQYYNIGAVIGIMTFVVLSVVALVTFVNSNSYKNEEAFR
jgi:arabinogalactan oligomer/maltooligosaccharide transport system permease protein